MLNLEFQVKEIIENDMMLRSEICKGYITMLKSDSQMCHEPEWYEKMDDGYPNFFSWHVYADALREFGCVIYIGDLMTGLLYLEWTRQLVKMLVDQYGLRNVTNEFAKQSAIKLGLR